MQVLTIIKKMENNDELKKFILQIEHVIISGYNEG